MSVSLDELRLRRIEERSSAFISASLKAKEIDYD